MGKFSINKLPSDILKDIANKVKVLRKAKGWSQEVLADRSGVSYGSIKRFETTGQIALESLLKIAHVLGRLGDFELILTMEIDDTKDHLFSIK